MQVLAAMAVILHFLVLLQLAAVAVVLILLIVHQEMADQAVAPDNLMEAILVAVEPVLPARATMEAAVAPAARLQVLAVAALERLAVIHLEAVARTVAMEALEFSPRLLGSVCTMAAVEQERRITQAR